MTSPTPGGQPVTPPADNVAPFDGALVPIPTEHIPGVPAPADVKRLLTARVNEAVVNARRARTAVKAEDYHQLVRGLTGFRELLGEYVAAFQAVMTVLLQIIEEELLEAVPEQDGIPTEPLVVPDADGSTIRVKAKVKTKHDVDHTQVVPVLAALVMERWIHRAVVEPDSAPIPGEQPIEFAIEVASEAVGMFGAAKMQKSKVDALRLTLGQLGADGLATVAKDAIHTTRTLDGVTVERKPA